MTILEGPLQCDHICNFFTKTARSGRTAHCCEYFKARGVQDKTWLKKNTRSGHTGPSLVSISILTHIAQSMAFTRLLLSPGKRGRFACSFWNASNFLARNACRCGFPQSSGGQGIRRGQSENLWLGVNMVISLREKARFLEKPFVPIYFY